MTGVIVLALTTAEAQAKLTVNYDCSHARDLGEHAYEKSTDAYYCER